MKSADDGAFGYNVFGQVPGSVKNGEKVVYGAHHDAYFRMGLDDTSGVVADLMMVKAMKMSGFKPARTRSFFSTTSEEWGFTELLLRLAAAAPGRRIKVTHPDWPGKVVGFVENELLGYKDGSAVDDRDAGAQAVPRVDGGRQPQDRRRPDRRGRVFNPDDEAPGSPTTISAR